MTYTPTTEEIRNLHNPEAFDRWLADVIRKAEAKALEEAADDVTNIDGRKDDKAAKWLRDRAQQLKEEA